MRSTTFVFRETCDGAGSPSVEARRRQIIDGSINGVALGICALLDPPRWARAVRLIFHYAFAMVLGIASS